MDRLLRCKCEFVACSRYSGAPIIVNGCVLPESYGAVLRHTDGFVLKRRWFRFFGIVESAKTPSIYEWNRSPWIAQYGRLAEGLVFFAEDVFGDQYAFRLDPSAQPEAPVKFCCEGGVVEEIGGEAMDIWLREQVLSDASPPFDTDFASKAFERGLRPTANEHLSFVVPLVVGGAYQMDNLEVFERTAHLHLLGQMSVKNLQLRDGERILRFKSGH